MVVTAVPKSVDIRSAALNLNAKAAALEQRLVGVWELAPTDVKPPEPESVISHDMKNEYMPEGVIGDDDGRTLVDAKDFGPGGKYRSIVKLLCHHEFQKPGSWMQGTGWLIRPDLLVTAGHCTYDWGHKFGRVTEVKAYIGYHGQQNINDPNVQFRHGKKIVAPLGWLRSKGNKPRDVGFMQLDKPFTGITPIEFTDTMPMGDQILGVVGYPGDKYDKSTHERGAHMYEMFEQTRWNLGDNNDTMLQYKIDTFGGNSGSPVLIQESNVSIGAHVYGGSVDTFNAASVIGALGNLYEDCINAFNHPIPRDGALHIISANQPSQEMGSGSAFDSQANRAPQLLPGASHIKPGLRAGGFAGSELVRRHGAGGFQDSRFPQSAVAGARAQRRAVPGASQFVGAQRFESEEEGFFDILKTVMKVGMPVVGGVLKTALPVALGPLGGPVGALAHAALGAAARMAESVEASGGAESDDPTLVCEGVVERAVLAEAALQTLQSIELSHAEEESIFSDMKDHVMKSLPAIKRTAAKVLPAMMEPALRIALDSLHKQNVAAGVASAEGFADDAGNAGGAFVPLATYSAAIDRPSGDRNAEQFLAGLQVAAVPPGAESGDDTEEGFMDFLKVGLRVGGGIFKQLSQLAESDELATAEGFDDMPARPHPEGPGGISTDALTKRAVVAEAALQALTKLPRRRLEEEGFFDGLIGAVKKMVPVISKVAPIVLDNVHPLAGQIARGILRSEGNEISIPDGAAPGSMSFRPARVPATGSTLRKQRSTGVLRGQAGNFLTRANKVLPQ